MKKLMHIVLAASLALVGCGKDSGGGGGGTTGTVAVTPNSTACTNASYTNGYWYDINNNRIDCSNFNSLVNNNYVYSYDNQFCNNRRPNNETTYMVYVGGTPKCAKAQYFYQLGYSGNLSTTNPYWIGYKPPVYAHNYYWAGIYNCWSCGYNSNMDNDYSGSDVLAAGLIGFGLGALTLGILNH